MDEFTNLIAQAQHNPTWNVYLCWVLLLGLLYMTVLQLVNGPEGLNGYQKKSYEDNKLVVNGKFTFKAHVYNFLAPFLLAGGHDMIVVLLNQGELIIVIYNKMFFAQFFSFTTISNFLT